MLRSKLVVISSLMAVLFGFSAQAQSSALAIEAPDTIPMLLSVDGKLVNSDASIKTTAENLSAGRHRVELKFSDEKYAPFSTDVHLLEGIKTTFRLNPKAAADGSTNFGLKLLAEARVLSDASTTEVVEAAPIAEEVEPLAEGTPELPDTATIDTTLPLPKAGCGSPPTAAQLLAFQEAQAKRSFQFDKQSAIKRFMLDYCLKVEQLEVILSALDFEDDKLELALLAKDHIYNPEQLPQLENIFHMDLMRQRWLDALAQR